MHVVYKDPFKVAAELYPNSRGAIGDCYRALSSGTFKAPDELRQVFPSLDNFKYRDRWWVIDISGNQLRLIAFIDFNGEGHLYVKHIVPHSEYDELTQKYREKKETAQKPKSKKKQNVKKVRVEKKR